MGENIIEATKVGVYFGSFDPPHDGHLEVINVSLQFCDDIVVTTVHSNRSKPLLSAYDHRIRMLENMVKGVNKPICIVGDGMYNLIKRYKGKSHLIGICGSDFYLKFTSKSRNVTLNMDEWLVIPREEYPIPQGYNKQLNRRTTVLDPKMFTKQGTSSTRIREYFLKNSNCNPTLPICMENQKYIVSNNLYKHLHKHKVLARIDPTEIIRAAIKGKYKFDCNTVRLNGHSGNEVYMVKRGSDCVCVAKVFKRKNDFVSEANSYKFFKDNGFNTVNTRYNLCY
jgi:cytidyltransferase-like protein